MRHKRDDLTDWIRNKRKRLADHLARDKQLGLPRGAHEFDLLAGDIRTIIEQAGRKCWYCKGFLDFSKKKGGHERDVCPTFDRVDSSKGYTKDNVVIACYACNSLKGANHIASMKMFIDGIERHKKMLSASAEKEDR